MVSISSGGGRVRAGGAGVAGGEPDQQPQHVGVALGVAAAGADADGAAVIGGCGPQPVASVVSRAAPVGVHSSIAGAPGGPAYDGTPRSSSATAGGGTGSVPCALRTVPGADRDGGDHDVARRRAEVHEAGADPDHVGDRVERADLVEVHVERVAAVHGALGDGQPLEGAGGQVAHRRRSRSARGEQVADVAPGAVVHGVGELDVAAGGGEAVAGDLLDAQRHRLGGDRVDRGLQHLDRHARRRAGRRAACRRWRPEEASTQTVVATSSGRRQRASAALPRRGAPGHPGGEDARAVPVVDVDHGDARARRS